MFKETLEGQRTTDCLLQPSAAGGSGGEKDQNFTNPFSRLIRHVCRLCHTGALGDGRHRRHMLLECPALSDLRKELSWLVADCSNLMTRLVWGRNQPIFSK